MSYSYNLEDVESDDVPRIEFKCTKLKHEIEEQNGTIYKFFMASIKEVE